MRRTMRCSLKHACQANKAVADGVSIVGVALTLVSINMMAVGDSDTSEA